MWWKMSLAVVFGVVLGFGLDYAVVRYQVVLLARRMSISGRPSPSGIHNFVIPQPYSHGYLYGSSTVVLLGEPPCSAKQKAVV